MSHFPMVSSFFFLGKFTSAGDFFKAPRKVLKFQLDNISTPQLAVHEILSNLQAFRALLTASKSQNVNEL